MQSFSKLILFTSLACSCLGAAEPTLAAREERGMEDTAFYEVPLRCPAARGIGCGPLAKPILLDLEKAPVVEEAWLDQAGEILAVVWSKGTSPVARTSALGAITEKHAVSMEELSGQTRTSALQSFRAREGWHRGADVDRLSEEEARVITERMLHRLVAAAPTARSKVESLRPTLVDETRQLLIETDLSEAARAAYSDEVLSAARTHLTTQEASALRDAMGLGLRPVGDEK